MAVVPSPSSFMAATPAVLGSSSSLLQAAIRGTRSSGPSIIGKSWTTRKKCSWFWW